MPQPRDLTAQAGLVLVAETMLALGIEELVERFLRVRTRRRGRDDSEKLQALVLVLAAGGDCVEDVRVLQRDAGLMRLLGRDLPSPDALHRFLRGFHDGNQLRTRPPTGAWIPAESDALRGLDQVNVEVIRRAVRRHRPREATLDLDATIIESHKRDALPHYKGGRGYQPTAVLWAEQDLVVADQYRDGNVPAGMSTLAVAAHAFAALPATVQRRFFRADSACYDERLLKWLAHEQVAFSISADMGRELRQVCTRRSVRWTVVEERPHETVAVAEVEFTPGEWPKDAQPLRYVALRYAGKQGALFAEADETKYLAVASNRWDLTPEALVRWHWRKAGTIEALHDVTKNDLGARLPPSGRFGANAAWYRLTLLTYNVLTVLKHVALPERLKDARPKRLRFEVFALPAALSRHSRQLTARLAAPPVTVEEMVQARRRLREFHARLLDGE